jgi:hypothetical protein
LRDDVIDAWLRRDQAGVPPMTMEWAPILACDADCPLCPYRRSRLNLPTGIVRDGDAASDDAHAATLETARRILEAARRGRVRGVLFTGGGEPLVWTHLIEALRHSASLGMDNCLYTNGFRLGLDGTLARALLAPETGLAFVRVSVNAISRPIVAKHWGLNVIQVNHQIEGLAALLRERNTWQHEYARLGRPVPSIQISTIVDRSNVGDLSLICRTVARVFGAHRVSVGAEDVMMVRPLTIHGRKSGYSMQDHDDAVIRSILRQCGVHGDGRAMIRDVGVPLYLGFGLGQIESGEVSSYSTLIEREYASRDVSWATGLFLTVGPNGSVYPTTEHNCDHKWAIGSLLQQTVEEIYASSRRRAVLAELNAAHWGPTVAQATSRTARLDRIAKAVMSGAIGPAEIARLAQSARESHRAILD